MACRPVGGGVLADLQARGLKHSAGLDLTCEQCFLVDELLRDSKRYKPTNLILLMDHPQINVVCGNYSFRCPG